MLEDFATKQKRAVDFIHRVFKNNKDSHAYIIESHGYSEQFDFALAFAKYILFGDRKDDCDFENLLDLKVISPENNVIKKEQLADIQSEFSTISLENHKRVYLINQAQLMNTYASNSLLKFLEEPLPNVVAILLCDNQYQLLTTITSRCQVISLNNKVSAGDSTLLKIGNYLFSNKEELNLFINEEGNLFIEKVLNFVEFYENNGLSTLCYTSSLWHDNFSDNVKILNALDVMILFYKDALNKLIGYKIEYFSDYISKVEETSLRNNYYVLVNKINILLKAKENIMYNENKNLLIDKIIIEFGGECYD